MRNHWWRYRGHQQRSHQGNFNDQSEHLSLTTSPGTRSKCNLLLLPCLTCTPCPCEPHTTPIGPKSKLC
jgi:hypothetical protein